MLDVGCGAGGPYAQALARQAGLYAGVDLSRSALLQRGRGGLQGLQADLERPLPFAPGSFDAAVCFEVLEHLFDPAALLSDIHRVLKPGGILIASVPNIAHLPQRLRLLGGKFVAGGHPGTADTPWCDPHIRFFTVRSLHDLLARSGFRVIELAGTSTAFLTSMPVISVALARALGRERVRRASAWFEPLGRLWPALFAGHLIVVAHQEQL